MISHSDLISTSQIDGFYNRMACSRRRTARVQAAQDRQSNIEWLTVIVFVLGVLLLMPVLHWTPFAWFTCWGYCQAINSPRLPHSPASDSLKLPSSARRSYSFEERL
jgi:hypothetical protein